MRRWPGLTLCNNWLAQRPRLVLGAAMVLLPLLILSGMEAIHRQSVAKLWLWMQTQPLEALLCWVLVMLFGGLIVASTGRLVLGYGIGGFVLLVLALISQYKMSFLREPLLPWDLFLSKQGADLLPYLAKGVGWLNIVTLVGFLLLCVLLWQVLPTVHLRRTWRAVLGGTAVVVFTVVSLASPSVLSVLAGVGVTNYVFEQDANFHYNGFALGFAMNVGNVVIHEPAGYNREAVQAALATAAEKTPAPNAGQGPSVQRPNVIFVMSEAFWDPTQLPNVTFDRDPLPNLRALMNKHTSGWLYSPQFGGGTANVEFEVLTGHSTSFLPAGSVAYQQYIRAPMTSLASLYAEEGYQTIALHSYEKWFWKRDMVYPYFGFQRFIGLDEFEQPAYNGPFVSDAEITKAIGQLTAESTDPLFLYTVTMQNHGPYAERRYENTIRVAGDVTEESRSILETYAQGLADSDAQLQELVYHLQKQKEPTMLVFFGDHLPVLNDVYRETGYFDDPAASATQRYTRQYTTPLLIWTNYKQPRQKIAGLNASFLGAKVLQMTNAKTTPYLDFVNRVAAQTPVLRHELVMSAEGVIHAGIPAELEELKHQYEILQYDQMFGKHFGR